MRIIKINHKGFTLLELMITITVGGIISALAIPAYQEYVTRSQVAESLALFEGKRTQAEEYLHLNGHENQSKAFQKISNIDSSYIEMGLEEYNPIDGYNVAFLYNEKSNKGLQGKTIVFFNENIEKDNILWGCRTNIEQKYLPNNLNCMSMNVTGNPIENEEDNNNQITTFYYRDISNLEQVIYYEDGVIYVQEGVDENGNPLFVKGEDYQYSHDENGNKIFNFGNMTITVSPNGYMDLLMNDGSNLLTFPNHLGGGSIGERVYANGVEHIKFPIVDSYTQIYSDIGQYGDTWAGAQNYKNLYQSSAELDYAYLDKNSTSNTIKDKELNYLKELQDFKAEVAKVKSENNGNFPVGFPDVYKYIYENY